MEMILTGIENKNEYYTNHYFTSIFQENAEDTIKGWKEREKNEEIQLPWKKLRDVRTQYYGLRDRYLRSKNEEASKPLVQELATLYLNALGYENINSVTQELSDGLSVPIFHEETKANGAPLLWAFLSVADEREDDILQGRIYEHSDDEEELGDSIEAINDEILAKLFFAGEEAPRFILLIGINQIALIDRNKWNEKRYLQFMMEDIYSRHEETTFMAMTVLLHKESLCPTDGSIILDSLDENSHKHSAGVSDALKYALRESIEILGNEVIYDMKTRQGINLQENPVDASELTLECLRYMYRFLFMLFIEARPELGYAPMKSQTYVQGYSLEGLRDVCDQVKEDSEALSEGYYIDDTLKKLFHMTYYGYPENLDQYKQAIEIEKNSMHDAFTIEALKAHIFDPEYTKLITKARLRNSAMLQIVDLMSISRPSNSKERKGRISYSALGINQMGAVYEALLSYRGFIAEEELYEVKRAGDKFNELDVGYFVKENELENYDEKTERVRYESGEKKGQLRMYEKGTFIYRLAGREREKSASYYTPEVLTKCLVKYALKELLKDKTADEILHLTVCEPAMGSAAFLNEAINQLAEAYLTKKQEELGETISYDKRFEELQKVKMYIADRNVYGCDLNPVAVELAEVSLWLNTIYKGAYVPWFGTQLVNGNSLIGARRQVYSQSLLESGKWYEKAPRRVLPGEERTKKGQHEHTKEIYHFLLGDPGMANYTDKVIKSLEPDKIKFLKEWNKSFTARFSEDELQTVLRLSESIDKLWKLTAEERRKIEKATYEPLSVYGHEETGESSHKTIREKDAIYRELFKSERAQNAGPYARLKAAMDYWCALWFWPIDKAELLPSRQEFFFDMSLILEGNIKAVNVNSSGQMAFVLNNEGTDLSIITEGDQLALEFKAQYADLGEVCLDDLRERSERLEIANRIAKQQKFQHWELEFADIFEDRGGFDLVLGNPPWVKLSWNEQDVLADSNPRLAVKKVSAAEVAQIRTKELERNETFNIYLEEYVSICSTQNFLDAKQNYEELGGQQTNLYKCFIPQSFHIGNSKAVIGLLHPDSVYDDPNGDLLRGAIYKRLRRHFQFMNMLKLFADVHTNVVFSINVYSNEYTDCFDAICNLYWPTAIDESYDLKCSYPLEGLRDENDNWSKHGNPERVLQIGKDELIMFSKMFGGAEETAKISPIHTKGFVGILSKIAKCEKRLMDYGEKIYATELWHETNDVKKGILQVREHFPEQISTCIYSSPHISNATPINKTTRRKYTSNGSYDNIDLMQMDENYIQRCLFEPTSIAVYEKAIPLCPWGVKYNNAYKLVTRKMLNLTQERTLMATIIPKEATHTFSLFGVAFEESRELILFAGVCVSIIGDFLIKVMGKSNTTMDNFGKIPTVTKEKYQNLIIHRVMLLMCMTRYFEDLWRDNYEDTFNDDMFSKHDVHLDGNLFRCGRAEWNRNSIAHDEYTRRQLLVELDVLVAMAFGLTIEELIEIYNIQFPVVKKYEKETWYDQNGRIVFSSKAFGNLTVDRKTFESNCYPNETKIIHEYEDDTTPDGIKTNRIVFEPPYISCNREEDYRRAWEEFAKRIQ